MKVFKKTETNPKPKLNGKLLDARYCAHLEKPRPIPMEKPCKSRRNCPTFRWVAEPWRKCSAGCGAGFSTRRVYCVNANNTTVDPIKCEKRDQPPKLRPCDSRSHCNWRPTKWKPVSMSYRQLIN